MSYGYPDGCTQADHDRYYDEGARSGEPDEDTVRLDCGHWGSEASSEDLGDKLVCFDCSNEADKLATVFEGAELPALIDALKQYGASRFGNHDLFRALLKKLERADQAIPRIRPGRVSVNIDQPSEAA